MIREDKTDEHNFVRHLDYPNLGMDQTIGFTYYKEHHPVPEKRNSTVFIVAMEQHEDERAKWMNKRVAIRLDFDGDGYDNSILHELRDWLNNVLPKREVVKPARDEKCVHKWSRVRNGVLLCLVCWEEIDEGVSSI